MAKVIYVCERRGLSPHTQSRITAILQRLSPDYIDLPEPLIRGSGDRIYGILNPGEEVEERGQTLLVGTLFSPTAPWERPGAPAPDGNFALFRDDDEHIEVVSDPAITNIWYYFDEERLICSTSQRAIIAYLGSFELNMEVLPWIMSTGGLGPGLAWDRRLKLLPPDSSLWLDRQAWSLRCRTAPVIFEASSAPDARQKEEFLETLDEVFQSLDLDLSRWTITLSGGLDSRGVLTFLARHHRDLGRLRSASWGTDASQRAPLSDPPIAKLLAQAYGLRHQFFALDADPPPLELALERFFDAGEGRIDHFSAYTDGFQLWKTLFDSGQRRLIRGDEGFDAGHAHSAQRARLTTGLAMCADFKELRDYQQYGLPPQRLPADLLPNDNESPSTWHTRHHHQYQLPVIGGALSTLKSAFGDQINPLLSRKILAQIRRLPDHLRRDKYIFRDLLRPLTPPLPFASQDGVVAKESLFQLPEFQALITHRLRSREAQTLLPQELLARTLREIEQKMIQTAAPAKRATFTERLKTFAKKRAPKSVKDALLSRPVSLSMDPTLLGFRLLMVVEMNARLSADAISLQGIEELRSTG